MYVCADIILKHAFSFCTYDATILFSGSLNFLTRRPVYIAEECWLVGCNYLTDCRQSGTTISPAFLHLLQHPELQFQLKLLKLSFDSNNLHQKLFRFNIATSTHNHCCHFAISTLPMIKGLFETWNTRESGRSKDTVWGSNWLAYNLCLLHLLN